MGVSRTQQLVNQILLKSFSQHLLMPFSFFLFPPTCLFQLPSGFCRMCSKRDRMAWDTRSQCRLCVPVSSVNNDHRLGACASFAMLEREENPLLLVVHKRGKKEAFDWEEMGVGVKHCRKKRQDRKKREMNIPLFLANRKLTSSWKTTSSIGAFEESSLFDGEGSLLLSLEVVDESLVVMPSLLKMRWESRFGVAFGSRVTISISCTQMVSKAGPKQSNQH